MNDAFRMGSGAMWQSPHVLKRKTRAKSADGTLKPLKTETRQMFKTVAFAAALATATAALPVTSAHAGNIDFGFTIETPNGSISFGNGGGGGYYPSDMSCWEAKAYLKSHFKKVQKIECNGDIYTFKVKNWGPWKTVKLDSDNGQYWFV
jgi:hypothetical protein